jgi:hypothetical protein
LGQQLPARNGFAIGVAGGREKRENDRQILR